jgi:uncharacterized protein YndB with AHSA1/START domain
MAIGTTHHGTIVVDGFIEGPAARVYAAYADPKTREAWGAPSDTATYFYEEADFRVGGRDVARCGAKADPRFIVEARYIDIVADHRIAWTEIIREVDQTLAANITTLEFLPEGAGTRLKVTVQVTSFIGEAMIANTKAGHAGSLANMARYFEKS